MFGATKWRGSTAAVYHPVDENTNTSDEVGVKKYAVSLDPAKVGRMRDEARRSALKEGRDVTWVGLLRGLMESFLAEAGRNEATAAGTTNGGGR